MCIFDFARRPTSGSPANSVYLEPDPLSPLVISVLRIKDYLSQNPPPDVAKSGCFIRAHLYRSALICCDSTSSCDVLPEATSYFATNAGDKIVHDLFTGIGRGSDLAFVQPLRRTFLEAETASGCVLRRLVNLGVTEKGGERTLPAPTDLFPARPPLPWRIAETSSSKFMKSPASRSVLLHRRVGLLRNLVTVAFSLGSTGGQIPVGIGEEGPYSLS